MASVSSFLWQTLPFFLTFLFASLDISSAKSVISSLYVQHCGSIAPESSPTELLPTASKSFIIYHGTFSAGNRINKHLFSSMDDASATFDFQPGQVHRTDDDGTLQLEGTLVLLGSKIPIRDHGNTTIRDHGKTTFRIRKYNRHRRVVFKLSGYWSEAKGKLCMVGTGEIHESQEEKVAPTLSAALKLDYREMSEITTSIIKGHIESLDKDTSPTYFEPIQILSYTQRRYEYTLTKKAEESCSHLPLEKSIESDSTSICSHLRSHMRYKTFTSSDLIHFLGFRFLSTSEFVCSEDGKVHLLMTLSNKKTRLSFKPLLLKQSLVAEGAWDHRNRRLCLLACNQIGKENNSSSVWDCSLGLTFWFPASFSLKQRSMTVGRMWNTSSANTIVSVYSINDHSIIEFSGLKYEYTELDKARKYCKVNNFNPNLTERYPDAPSHMDIQLYTYGTRDKSFWGHAEQISTDEFYHGSQYDGTIIEDSMYTTQGTTNASNSGLANQNRAVWNVGYTITYTVMDKNNSDSVHISAEGIYNPTMGTICLVGCRQQTVSHTTNGENLNSSAGIDERNLDCTFFIQLQFDSGTERGRGTISSTRENSDPLFFEPIEIIFFLKNSVCPCGCCTGVPYTSWGGEMLALL